MPSLDQLASYHGLLIALALLLAGAGMPLPMAPLLLAAGSLARMGKLNLAAALLILPICLTLGDILWFYLGRRFGQGILATVCRVSFERDACIQRTQDTFAKHGLRVLLFSRFVAGLSTLASPMAGATGKPFRQFLPFEFVGTAIYTTTYMILGVIFANQLDSVLAVLGGAGKGLSIALVILFVLYAGYKFLTRYLLIRKSLSLVLDPTLVHQRLLNEPDILLVDLRGSNDLAVDPFTIEGARRIRERELLSFLEPYPRHTPIVLYCACPNNASSTRVALILHRHGFINAAPMRDGLKGWRAAGLPVQPAQSPSMV